MSSSLTERDICEVLRILSDVSDWKKLGIQLTMTPSKLDTFSSKSDPMTDMIQYWIQNHLDTSNWGTLADALEQMDRRDIASNIRREYMGDRILNVREEAQKALSELDDRKCEISQAHFTVHQSVNKFVTEIQLNLDSNKERLKKEFRGYCQKDEERERKIKKELENKKKICDEQKIKLQKILSKSDFDMTAVDEVTSIKRIIETVQDQIEQIQSEVDDIEQIMSSATLVQAELNNAEFLVEELMGHLKIEDIYVNRSTSITSITSITSADAD